MDEGIGSPEYDCFEAGNEDLVASLISEQPEVMDEGLDSFSESGHLKEMKELDENGNLKVVFDKKVTRRITRSQTTLAAIKFNICSDENR